MISFMKKLCSALRCDTFISTRSSAFLCKMYSNTCVFRFEAILFNFKDLSFADIVVFKMVWFLTVSGCVVFNTANNHCFLAGD